jgi:methylglutaconyl-CoA hydratase
MNRPDKHNAFNEHVIADIHRAFDSIVMRDDLPTAVVLTGAGASFSAGAGNTITVTL